MGKLKDVEIRAWVKAGQPVAKSDGQGLTFTLSKAGRAAWILRYRFGGKAKEKTLGQYPDLSLAEARKFAAEDRVKIQQGIDVALEKQRAKRDAAGAWTVRELAEDFLQKADGRLEVSTINGQKQRLRDYIYPLIGSMPAKDIGPSDIVAVVAKAGKKSRHVARLVHGGLKAVFDHGVGLHITDSNPVAQVKVSAIIGPRPVPRSRVMLSEEELRVILPLARTMGRENALMLKILLATAVRIGELVAARWANIDFDKRIWVVPATDIKGKKVKARNGEDVKDFVIPLTDQVAAWFAELKELAFGSGYVLPVRARKNAEGDAHMDPVTLNAAFKKIWETYLAESCQRFTPHDLRSTARSHLGRLGVDLLIAERCLNHSLGGLVAVYDQHDYLEERRKALTLWSGFLDACEHGRPCDVPPLHLAA